MKAWRLSQLMLTMQATPCWIFASPSLDRPDHENLAEPYERRGSAVWTLIAVTAVC
jgi:hypothetical protein